MPFHQNLKDGKRPVVPFKILLIVKLTTAFLTLTLMHASAGTLAQRVTLAEKNAPLEKILLDLKKQSGFNFLYNTPMLAEAKPVTLNVNNAPLAEALRLCFAGQPLDFTIKKKTIIVRRKPLPIRDNLPPPIMIKGRVLDPKNEPLQSVNVNVKGSSVTTQTDANGNFTITAPDGASTLVFSFIGYTTQEVAISRRTQINVQLAVENASLSDVVVVGYGTQRKASLTSAVSSVNSEDIVTTKNENVVNSLTGKVSGLRVVQNSSEPGNFDNSYDVRGLGTPLIVIDGIPRDNITRLDPNDIESVSVLKDASAAVYGVRAANGVILVTTKKGKKGGVVLNYSGNFTMQFPSGLPKPLDAIGYMTLTNEKLLHNVNGGIISYQDADFEAYRNGSKISTDWYKPTIKDIVPQTQHNMSVTGGNENTNYFLSLGYTAQDGFLRSGDLNYERFNVRSNISSRVTKDLTVDLNITGILDTKDQPYQDTWWIIRSFWRQNPLEPVYANNNPEYFAHTPVDGTNPVAMSDKSVSGYKTFTNRWFQSSISLTYKIPLVEGLRAKALYSYDYNSEDNKIYQRQYDQFTYDGASDVYTPKPQQAPNQIRREYFTRPNTLSQLSLNYDRTFNKHSVSALVLWENSVRNSDNLYAQRELALAVDQLLAGNSVNQVGNMNSGDLFKDANRGLVGRLNYNFDSKYLAEFSFRRDGSSKFPKDRQFGFFPSASLGYRVSEENFFKNSNALSFIQSLKVRASYGELGDDRASSYQFISGYLFPATGNANELPPGHIFDGEFISSLQSKGLSNPFITWYVAKTFDIGIDVEAWKGLLGFTVDYFSRDRTGLLATRSQSLPGVVGAALPEENLNSDRTKGFDLEVNHRNNLGKFNYYLKAVLSFTRTSNQFVERSAAGNSYENWRNNSNNRYNNAKWGWSSAGRFNNYEDIINSKQFVNRSTVVGDYIYEDWNQDGIIDDHDVHPIAYQGIPLMTGGLTIGGSFKGFDFNILFQGSTLSNIGYTEQLREALWGGGSGVTIFLDRWHPADPKADPYDPNTQWISGKYGYTGSNPDENSEFNVQDNSYLRIKTAEIGYSLSERIARKVGIKAARIFANGYNIVTWSKVKFVDPEHPNTLYSYLYPLNKTVSLGLNVTF